MHQRLTTQPHRARSTQEMFWWHIPEKKRYICGLLNTSYLHHIATMLFWISTAIHKYITIILLFHWNPKFVSEVGFFIIAGSPEKNGPKSRKHWCAWCIWNTKSVHYRQMQQSTAVFFNGNPEMQMTFCEPNLPHVSLSGKYDGFQSVVGKADVFASTNFSQSCQQLSIGELRVTQNSTARLNWLWIKTTDTSLQFTHHNFHH